MGKIKAAQILIAFPPDADEAQKQATTKKANELYEDLKKGQLFDNLARTFSNDYVSAQSGGLLAEFGTGKYDPIFETAVYNLEKDSYSKPFATSYGYHIVKKLEQVPVSSDRNDGGAMQFITDQIKNDSRQEIVRTAFAQSILKTTGYKPFPINRSLLLKVTDSVLAGSDPAKQPISDKSPLHNLGNQKITVGNFWQFAKDARSTQQFRNKNAEGLLEEYINATALEYYKDHLEDYNKDFRNQLMEFKDGNLLFEAMERNIWNKSAQDSAGLVKHYNANKSKYKWDRSADAIIFTTSDMKIAQELSEKIKKEPHNWRDIMLPYSNNGTAQADSNRYLLSDIPVADRTAFSNGLCTAPFNMGNDGSAGFAYIYKVHEAGPQRSFEEARGAVINDYQTYLEEQWIAALKKKYPVKINNTVWNDVLKKGQ